MLLSEAFVVQPGRTYREFRGSSALEMTFPTRAVVDDQLYLRAATTLYSIGSGR
ncbi:MAG: hypothetical protein VYE68_01515 [Acidobacteriota bacterium]|nr:hypothetical protein [Acidobacteriota bacterium]